MFRHRPAKITLPIQSILTLTHLLLSESRSVSGMAKHLPLYWYVLQPNFRRTPHPHHPESRCQLAKIALPMQSTLTLTRLLHCKPRGVPRIVKQSCHTHLRYHAWE